MDEVNSENTNCPEDGDDDSGAREPLMGMSPYATGGGGVTFERRVAVQYLAHLLVGDGAVGFGDGRHIVSVAFQQFHERPADDLVVRAARDDEPEPSLEIAFEVRRSPNLVPSDEAARRLMGKFIRAVTNAPDDGVERRLGLVISGSATNRHAQQLGTLAGLAATQMDAQGFFNLVYTPNEFDSGVRSGLEHIEKLVELALQDLDGVEPDVALVRKRAWQLLSTLVVLAPRLESPDETDWASVLNSLKGVARTSDLEGASRLRDRLVSLASDYSPKAARINLKLLRRDAHELLDPDTRRHQRGWQALDQLNESALNRVRGDIADSDGVRRKTLDRKDSARELLSAISDAKAGLVIGESGVGKSALAVLSLAAECDAKPENAQALCVNLRDIPELAVDFENRLSCPLSDLLGELSASLRVLIVDGVDAVAEGKENTFRYLVDAAAKSDVKVVAVAAQNNAEIALDVLNDRFGSGVAEYPMQPLTDAELDEVAEVFPELDRLIANPRSRDLLRRLVVVDLLVRGGIAGVPLTDADAMQEVWDGLVRRRERSDRGQPDAREFALLNLAKLSVSGGDRLQVMNSLDQEALTGLRRDGLLRTPTDQPYMVGPDFAHDEVRRYAVARLLLSEEDLTSKIMNAGAPRWTLSAATLACQARLSESNTPSVPLRGRFSRLQASFDALVEAGYGARWGDAPSEALIALANPSEILRDAWDDLRSDDAAGLRRLARIVGQRHRDQSGFISPEVIEPIVKLLLEDTTPWNLGEYAYGLLRDWLRGHIHERTASGHPLRTKLHERLAVESETADRRLDERRKAEAKALAERVPEDIAWSRQIMVSTPELFESGYGRRRQRPDVPREHMDKMFLELLALLGPDLDARSAGILRRVARDAPWSLAPALELPFTNLAISQFSPKLLALLTEAYYLDEESDGLGFHGYGIRRHDYNLGLPSAMWLQGPFYNLFVTDFTGGVAVLNRMLNHATRTRVRSLVRLPQMGGSPEDIDISPYQSELEITGVRRIYVGDDQVWLWYRGTGVGPYPCMSALQALERVCDQMIESGVSTKRLVEFLLNDCENLAMVGLVVGILVRHLESAGDSLDPYFAEPLIWRLEFMRVVQEGSMIAADSEGVAAPERREWNLGDASILMVSRADSERASVLATLGDTLVERARREIEQQRNVDSAEESTNDDRDIEQQLAEVRAWASRLDYSKFQLYDTPDGQYIQAAPSNEVIQALQPSNEDLARVAEETRLINRYCFNIGAADSGVIETDELMGDIESARKLLKSPTTISVHHPYDVPALVAAAVLEARLLRYVGFPEDALNFAIEIILQISESKNLRSPFEFEETHFELGANRSAARVLPLLLMPIAASTRATFDGSDGAPTFNRVSVAGLNLARSVANEVRLYLARGLDHLWDTPCVQNGICHHRAGWRIAKEMMRDCATGAWNPETQASSLILLDEPLSASLSNTADDSIMPDRLDASIRALAPAVIAEICVSPDARKLLEILLAAQRRSSTYHERNQVDIKDTHSLVSARALLTLAQRGDDAAIYEHINAYADNLALLDNYLSALSVAAAETPDRATTARRIWPAIFRHALELLDSGNIQFRQDFYGKMALAALLPNAASKDKYLFYAEIQDKPILWWNPYELRSEVESWLAYAAGNADSVDQLIIFLKPLSLEDQVRLGVPWVAKMVLPSPSQIAGRSFMLAEWLIEIHPDVTKTDLSDLWQQIVDALVVEGDTRLAPYSV